MNLIVTCARHLESETRDELDAVLEDMGDQNMSILITEMSGILIADTSLDPIEVVHKIKEIVIDEPWSIRYCLRIIPIQRVVETKNEDIVNAASDMLTNISKENTYRISIEKRNSNISSREIISKIANKIENKVSLEFPDKVILIEILGNKTGISILKQSDILSIEKTKRSMSE